MPVVNKTLWCLVNFALATFTVLHLAAALKTASNENCIFDFSHMSICCFYVLRHTSFVCDRNFYTKDFYFFLTQKGFLSVFTRFFLVFRYHLWLLIYFRSIFVKEIFSDLIDQLCVSLTIKRHFSVFCYLLTYCVMPIRFLLDIRHYHYNTDVMWCR